MCLAQGPQRSDSSEDRTCGPSVSSQALYHCAPIKKFKNNLDPGQATMVVFPDTMYTCRDIQGWGGGVKIDNFLSYLTFVTAKLMQRGARGLDPLPWKKLVPPPRKNVGAPLEPRKIIISFEKNPFAFCKISGVLLKRTKRNVVRL